MTTKFYAKSTTLLGEKQVDIGTPAVPTGDDALAVTDLEVSEDFSTKDYVFAGKVSRDVVTEITDKTRSITYNAFFPAYGTSAPVIYNLLEASGASVIVGSTPLIKATNSIESCDVATLYFLNHQLCVGSSKDKTRKLTDAGALVDLTAEMNNRVQLKFSWQGNYSLPEDTPQQNIDYGEQKQYLAPQITRSNLIKARLQPEGSIVSDKNICFQKVEVTNFFGSALERFRLSCEDGYARTSEAGEVKITLLEEDMAAEYNPEANLSKNHDFILEWGVSHQQGIHFDKMQLINISRTEIGSLSGLELTFKNRGYSELYNLTQKMGIREPTDNAHYKYGYVGQNYQATFTVFGGTGTETWSIQNAPPNLTLDPATGVLSGTINAGSEGITDNVAISVTKGGQSVVLTPFTYTITTESLFPIAVDDTKTDVPINSTATIDVLSNDFGGQGTLTLNSIVNINGEGTAVINDNKIDFTAGANAGTTIVTYQVVDDAGEFDTGDLTITVIPQAVAKGWRIAQIPIDTSSWGVLIGKILLKNAGNNLNGSITSVAVNNLINDGGYNNNTESYNCANSDRFWNHNPSATFGYASAVFSSPVIVDSYSMMSGGGSHGPYMARNWELQYSTDTTDGHDGTWTTLHTVTNEPNWSDCETRNYTGFNG